MTTVGLAFPKPKDKEGGKDKVKKYNGLNKPINKISIKKKKQAPKDKKIYNALVKDSTVCQVCGCKEATQIHHVFGASNRNNSTKYGYLKHICNECHRVIEENQEIDLIYKIEAEKEFLKGGTREEFIRIFGKSNIEEE